MTSCEWKKTLYESYFVINSNTMIMSQFTISMSKKYVYFSTTKLSFYFILWHRQVLFLDASAMGFTFSLGLSPKGRAEEC